MEAWPPFGWFGRLQTIRALNNWRTTLTYSNASPPAEQVRRALLCGRSAVSWRGWRRAFCRAPIAAMHASRHDARMTSVAGWLPVPCALILCVPRDARTKLVRAVCVVAAASRRRDGWPASIWRIGGALTHRSRAVGTLHALAIPVFRQTRNRLLTLAVSFRRYPCPQAM